MVKEILEIFKKDLKTITKNRIVLIMLIILICIPSFYAIVNIKAVWNPYNDTSNMKIAIVDNDAGYTTQGMNYNFGKLISENIAANNTNFNWQFVDENTARNGVKNGEYYAAIILPSNFTQTLLTQTTSKPQQSQIDYLVNEKLNPISPRITNNTAVQLQSQINLAITQAKVNIISGNSTGVTLNSNDQSDPNLKPVAINTKRIYPVDNYGSSMAPFFIVLSLFIGCTMSIALITTRIKGSKKKYKSLNVYFGRMGLFLIISISQALLMSYVVLNSHIQVTSTLLFPLTMLFIGLCFMVMLYSLTSLFGNVGKALAILLLALQIMGTGGTYPTSLLSTTFQVTSSYLPFTYAVEALRQVTLGMFWSTYWYNLEMLLIFPAVTFIVTLLIKGELDKYMKLAEDKVKESNLF